MPRHPHEPTALRLIVRRAPCRCSSTPCSCPPSALQFSTPLTPGWSMVARNPAEVALAIERAWVESTIAAYARLRGVLFDLAETEEEIPPEAFAVTRRHPGEPDPDDRAEHRRRTKHPRTHDPEDWVECEDGAMLSPSGQRWGPETRVASAVRARRDER
jgi:hypothetical protein